MGQYSDPYPTGDPMKTEAQMDAEAALAWVKLQAGDHPDDICRQMGISRRTFYRRIDALILAQEMPSRSIRQLLAEVELSKLKRITNKLLERIENEGDGDPVPLADAAKIIAEARQLNLSHRRLFGTDEEPASAREPQRGSPGLPAHLREYGRRAEEELAARERAIREEGRQ